MKLNLPTTWTNQKMSTLLLLTFLQVNVVKAGQTFKDCLQNLNNTQSDSHSYYNSLNNYPWSSDPTINSPNNVKNNFKDNSGGTLTKLKLCCDFDKCSVSNSTGWGDCPSNKFICVKLDQTIDCLGFFGNSKQCGGMVNSDAPMNFNYSFSVGPACPNINDFNSYLNKTVNAGFLDIPSAFGTNTIIRDNVSKKIIFFECQNNTCKDYDCAWDNGGWSCLPNFSDPLGDNTVSCFFQFSDSYSSVVSNNSNFSSSTTNSVPSNNPNLIPIIAPIGTVVGIGSLSGLTYYLIKKRKSARENKDQTIALMPTQGKNSPQRESLTNQDDILATLKRLSLSQLKDLQREDTPLSREITYYSPLLSKEMELTNLKADHINKAFGYQNIEKDLDELLELETKILTDDSRYLSEQQKIEIIDELTTNTQLTREELEYFCHLQTEIINLKIKLAKQRRRLNRHEINHMNNYIINIQQGNALLGNQLGNNSNLSHNNISNKSSMEIAEENQQIAQQEFQQIPKTYQ